MICNIYKICSIYWTLWFHMIEPCLWIRAPPHGGIGSLHDQIGSTTHFKTYLWLLLGLLDTQPAMEDCVAGLISRPDRELALMMINHQNIKCNAMTHNSIVSNANGKSIWLANRSPPNPLSPQKQSEKEGRWSMSKQKKLSNYSTLKVTVISVPANNMKRTHRHNLISVTCKVSDHHLYHAWQWLVVMSPHWQKMHAQFLYVGHAVANVLGIWLPHLFKPTPLLPKKLKKPPSPSKDNSKQVHMQCIHMEM